MSNSVLQDKKIVLGVTGSIAAYKACDLVRRLLERGAQVQVIMTEAAHYFVGADTLRNLSGMPVLSAMFEEPEQWDVKHISVAEWADLVVIAPATAQAMASLAQGLADELLFSTVLATQAPIMLAPAMNDNMWLHKATQDNRARLEAFGYQIVGPETGKLASGKTGKGRMVPVKRLVAEAERLLSDKDLEDLRVVVTAGPTREAIDKVRFITNRSSGKMGYALAESARRRGAKVTLISGPTALADPYGVEIVRIESAEQMHQVVMKEASEADIFIAAAAVGDFTPAEQIAGKLRREGEITLKLKATPDGLASVGQQKKGRPRVVVGFAAESEDLIESARAKLARKGIDLIVANDISQPQGGFESDFNQASLIFADGRVDSLERLNKLELANEILNAIRQLLEGR